MDFDEPDEEEMQSAAEIYDISDVKHSLGQTKSRKEIWIRFSSESDFNLMRFYLCLRSYVDKMEIEMGIQEGPGPDVKM
jgi:hypothetical protein